MTNSIVSVSSESNQSSPFDSIRGYRVDGSEFWTARELMRFLGYTRWDNFKPTVDQAIENLELAGNNTTDHILFKEGLGTLASLANPKSTLDYELSRLACYHVALACNGKGKPMVAMAKQYFAMQTRKQEIAESAAPIVVERQLPPQRDAIDYANAAIQVSSLPDSRLKRLLDARLVAELSIDVVNQKQIAPSEPVKNYTTATVRAAMLGYSANQIGNGSSLGKFIKAEITPDFSDWQGQFNVVHYEVCSALDSRIHAYFLTRSL